MDYIQSSSLDFERGRLLKKTVFNSNGYTVSQDQTTYSNNVTYYSSPAPVQAANAVLTYSFQACAQNEVDVVSRTPYQLFYYPFVPINHIINTYDLNLTGSNNLISSTTNTTYDQYKNVIEQDVTNSDGTIQKVRYKYAYNFSNNSQNNPYMAMVNQNMVTQVVEKIQSVVIGGTESVIGGELHTYQIESNLSGFAEYNDAIYGFESITPVAYSAFVQSSYNGTNTPGQLNMDGHYKLRESLFYDNFGNISSTLDDAGRRVDFIWDYNKSKPVARIVNANTASDIAYSSFEYNVPSDLTNGGGNWSGITLSNVVATGNALSGSNYYTLTGSTLVSPALSSSQNYIVSYWSKNGAYTVTGTTSSFQGITLPSGWTYFQHIIGNSSSVSVTGTGSIDELRLYPQTAQMSTYTYEPLVGIKSIVDPKSQVSYYQYDDFHRLSYISDQTGSIIKAYNYNYAAAINQPVITNLYANGTSITVGFTPVSGCNSAQITWKDLTINGTPQSSNGGCGSPAAALVPSTGHTYQFTVTCYSALNPGGVTSAPVNVSN